MLIGSIVFMRFWIKNFIPKLIFTNFCFYVLLFFVNQFCSCRDCLIDLWQIEIFVANYNALDGKNGIRLITVFAISIDWHSVLRVLRLRYAVRKNHCFLGISVKTKHIYRM